MTVEELETRLHNLEQEVAAASDSVNRRCRTLEHRLDEIDKVVERALSDAEYAAIKVRDRKT